MFLSTVISLTETIFWIFRILIPILIIYFVYVILTKALKFLGFSNIESTIILIVSFIFTFPIIIFGYDISNIALFKYNNWIVGINTGGALIPIILSFYLIFIIISFYPWDRNLYIYFNT